MAIRYTVRPFKPGKTGGAHAAHVLYGQPAGAAEILDRVVSGGSTLTRADVAACAEALAAAVESLVCEGRRVNLFGIAEVYPRVRGTFEDAFERFDPARHTLDAGGCAGERLRRAVRRQSRPQRAIRAASSPNVTAVCAPGTALPPATIEAGSLMRISGQRLKVDPSRADEGVLLVSRDGGPPVACRQIARNSPSEILAVAPRDLPQGVWTLEVRARMRHASGLSVGQFGPVTSLAAGSAQLPAAA